MDIPSSIDSPRRLSRVDPGPVTALNDPPISNWAGHYSETLMMHWYQELASRAERMTASSSLQEQDGRRYTVLMAACQNQDAFYVKVHELCCLWSIDKTAVHDVFDSLANRQAIDLTFSTLHRILNNEDLASSNLEWFANFPWSVKRMLTSFPERVLAVYIAKFIEKFAAIWQPLLDAAETNDRPVSRVAMRDNMHCASPVLRYILYIASCLQIGMVEGPELVASDDESDTEECEARSTRTETVRQVLATEHANFVRRQPSS